MSDKIDPKFMKPTGRTLESEYGSRCPICGSFDYEIRNPNLDNPGWDLPPTYWKKVCGKCGHCGSMMGKKHPTKKQKKVRT